MDQKKTLSKVLFSFLSSKPFLVGHKKFSKYSKLIGSITPIIPIILRLTVTKGKGWITLSSSEDIEKGKLCSTKCEQYIFNDNCNPGLSVTRFSNTGTGLSLRKTRFKARRYLRRLVSCSVPLGLLSAPASHRFKIICSDLFCYMIH